MKKTIPLVLIILLPLIFSSSCEGKGVSVQPPEISITMNDNFINGNTSKKIAITNNDEYNINVTWYIEHPNPISWMRQNRTCITNLSWIEVKPKWHIVHPKTTEEFYIYLDIPESDDLLNQQWETWITFKINKQENDGDMFNQEYAIRVYIDTPKKTTIWNDANHHNNSNYNLYTISLHVALAAAIALTILIAAIWFYKKKR
jgi:hypothetical protein